MTQASSTIVYRLAGEADIEPTYEIMVAAADDLNEKLGRAVAVGEHSPVARALAVRRAALKHGPERFWIAERDGITVGFGLAIQREYLVYLAALHVMPDCQAHGVGAELMRRCMSAPAAGPSVKMTISEAANLASNGLYARFGMFPVMAIQQIAGPAAACAPVPGLALSPAGADDVAGAVRELDRAALGICRDEDHATWVRTPGLSLHLLTEKDQVLGYIYVDYTGALGPAVGRSPKLLVEAVANGAAFLAHKGISTVHLRVPGAARELLAMLIGCGFRYEIGTNLLLADGDLGSFSSYLFSGADALF